MHWLQQRSVTPKKEHFLAKLDHYGIEAWQEKMRTRLTQMNEPAFVAVFDAEMKRFLPGVHMQALEMGLRRMIFETVEQQIKGVL